jgi:hypothetical protein
MSGRKPQHFGWSKLAEEVMLLTSIWDTNYRDRFLLVLLCPFRWLSKRSIKYGTTASKSILINNSLIHHSEELAARSTVLPWRLRRQAPSKLSSLTRQHDIASQKAVISLITWEPYNVTYYLFWVQSLKNCFKIWPINVLSHKIHLNVNYASQTLYPIYKHAEVNVMDRNYFI